MSEGHFKPETNKQRLKFFVGRIGPETTNLSLRTYCGRFGLVHIAKTEISKRSGKKKGFGYVIYEYLMDPAELCSRDHLLDGKSVYINFYRENVLSRWHDLRSRCLKIQFTGVPIQVTELELVHMIENYGKVLVSNCPRIQPRAITYTCTVEIENTANTLKALNRAGFEFDYTTDELKCCARFGQLHSNYKNQEMFNKDQAGRPLEIQGCSSIADNMQVKNISESTGLLIRKGKSFTVHQDKHSKYSVKQGGILSQSGKSLFNYRFNIAVPQPILSSSTMAAGLTEHTLSGVVVFRRSISTLRPPSMEPKSYAGII